MKGIFDNWAYLGVGTFAVHNFETTVAQTVHGQTLSEARVVYVRLLDSVGSEVTVRRPLQGRRRVETFAVHNFETAVV